MSSNGKRLLASLFGIHLNEDPPQLQRLVPQRISNEIMTGTLPTYDPSTIMLGKSKIFHFVDKVALAVQKQKKYSAFKVCASIWKQHSGRELYLG